MARKIVCVIIYQSGQKNILTNKINNFLACMDCHIMRSNFERSAGEIAILKGKIHEIKSLEELTIEGIDRQANKLCTPKEHSKISWLTYMEIYTRKEREIYKALSLGKVNNSLMQFNIYLSSNKLPLHIQPSEALPPLTLNVRETGRLPPSKFDTNFILKWPQQIVNIYGVPSYT